VGARGAWPEWSLKFPESKKFVFFGTYEKLLAKIRVAGEFYMFFLIF